MELEPLVKACEKALFSGTKEAVSALEYLKTCRGLNDEIIRDVRFGICPGDKAFLSSFCSEKEVFANKKILGKIVLPIMSEFDKVAGLAARCPDPNEKGWWNTSFDKSKYIFLFNKGRKDIFHQNRAYIFEGYIDALILRQSGLMNAIAVMGTSLGHRRIGLISRYCNSICICYDNDKNRAGYMGQLKTMADLNVLGFHEVSKIELPEKGQDPDEFVLKHGLDAFLALEKEVTRQELLCAREQYEEMKEQNRNFVETKTGG